jgi:hypothetical protein
MRHPFDLTANFVAVREVVLGGAADALLDGTTLAPDDAAYLDAVGNRNGVYDLGDFLAAHDRSTGSAGGAAASARAQDLER